MWMCVFTITKTKRVYTITGTEEYTQNGKSYTTITKGFSLIVKGYGVKE